MSEPTLGDLSVEAPSDVTPIPDALREEPGRALVG